VATLGIIVFSLVVGMLIGAIFVSLLVAARSDD
jgi:hypothetical protein